MCSACNPKVSPSCVQTNERTNEHTNDGAIDDRSFFDDLIHF